MAVDAGSPSGSRFPVLDVVRQLRALGAAEALEVWQAQHVRATRAGLWWGCVWRASPVVL